MQTSAKSRVQLAFVMQSAAVAEKRALPDADVDASLSSDARKRKRGVVSVEQKEPHQQHESKILARPVLSDAENRAQIASKRRQWQVTNRERDTYKNKCLQFSSEEEKDEAKLKQRQEYRDKLGVAEVQAELLRLEMCKLIDDHLPRLLPPTYVRFWCCASDHRVCVCVQRNCIALR